jgi:hypothetical protein
VGFRTSVEALRAKSFINVGHLTALTESHSQWASNENTGYINVRTVSEKRRVVCQ